MSGNALVAQLDRASDYGSEGCEFEPRRVRQFFMKDVFNQASFFVFAGFEPRFVWLLSSAIAIAKSLRSAVTVTFASVAAAGAQINSSAPVVRKQFTGLFSFLLPRRVRQFYKRRL